MRKNRYQMLALLTLLFGMLLLTACAAAAAADGQEAVPAEEEQMEQTEQAEPTLEDLLGEDYVSYLTETITMQMGNRMEKTLRCATIPSMTTLP